MTKKDYLGNIGKCGKEVAGCAHHIVDAAELERLEVVILAFGVNHQAIQKAPGHINDLEPSKNLALPFLCGEFSRQVLHFIDGLNGAVQQFWSAAVCGLCITDRFVQSDVLRDAPKLIDRVRSVLWQNAVLEHEAPAVMDGKCPVLTEYLIVFRHTEAASTSAERVPWVVIEKGGVVRLDDRTVKNADIVDRLDVFPVHRLIEAAAIIDEHHSNGSTEQSCPLNAGHGRLFPVQLIESLLVEILDFLIGNALQLKSMFDCLLGRSIYDFGKQTIALIVHGQQLIGNRILWDKFVLLRGVLLCAVFGHHVDISISAIRPYRLAGLLVNQVCIPADTVHL